MSSMRPLHRVIMPSLGRPGGRDQPSPFGQELLKDSESKRRTAQVSSSLGPSANISTGLLPWYPN